MRSCAAVYKVDWLRHRFGGPWGFHNGEMKASATEYYHSEKPTCSQHLTLSKVLKSGLAQEQTSIISEETSQAGISEEVWLVGWGSSASMPQAGQPCRALYFLKRLSFFYKHFLSREEKPTMKREVGVWRANSHCWAQARGCEGDRAGEGRRAVFMSNTTELGTGCVLLIAFHF